MRNKVFKNNVIETTEKHLDLYTGAIHSWSERITYLLIGLSDSENYTITIVKVLIFTIVNTITIVGDQFFNTMILNKKA